MVDSMEIDSVTDEEVPNERSVVVENIVAPTTTEPQIVAVSVNSLPSNVFVATSAETGLFTADEDSGTLKAARIIIHDPATGEVLKTPQTVTFNSLNRSLSVPERSNNWDSSAYDPVIPVRCRNIRGELHKNRFGSGSRGRSICVGDTWCTPYEFEALCGRGNSKDWKRSIRYGGRTLQCLIDEGILRPHATSCTCSACCDDIAVDGDEEATSGPVRLFIPYKRRRRQTQNRGKLKVSTNVRISNSDDVASAPAEIRSAEIHTNGTSSSELKSIPSLVSLLPNLLPKEATMTISSDSVIVTPTAAVPAPQTVSSSVLDFNEQRKWWQLEEMVKVAVRQALELQKQVETLKKESNASREAALQQLRAEMENEKKEALKSCRLEAQMNLSRALVEAKAEKQMAIEETLQQARLEMQEKYDKGESFKQRCTNCDREAFSECTGCHRVSYCSTFCQRRDWENHREECGDENVELVEDCIDSVM